MKNEYEVKELLKDAERRMWTTKDHAEYGKAQIQVLLLQDILGYKDGQYVKVGEDVNPSIIPAIKSEEGKIK